MFNSIARLLVLVACVAGMSGPVQAVPVQYDFSATGFSSVFGITSTPNSSLSGSVTIDGDQIDGINLVIGNHTFTSSEVVAETTSTGVVTVGGLIYGASAMILGTADFWLIFDSNLLEFSRFAYSVEGVLNDFYATTSGVVSEKASVSEPATLALVALAGLVGVSVRRRRSV